MAEKKQGSPGFRELLSIMEQIKEESDWLVSINKVIPIIQAERPDDVEKFGELRDIGIRFLMVSVDHFIKTRNDLLAASKPSPSDNNQE